MKKLYRAILLVLLPAFIYASFFYANDPHDYFGLKAQPADFDSLTGHMLDYRQSQYDAILLGDSRTGRITEDYLNNATGLHFKNMSFAGCTIREYTKLFWWCAENGPPLKRVVIVTSFYATNQVLQHDRVTIKNQQIQNPVTYAFNVDSLKDLTCKLRDSNYGYPSVDIVFSEEEKEKNFETYRKSLAGILAGYQYAKDDLEALEEICDYCNSHDIEIYLVLPAWWKGYFAELDAAGLLSQADSFKRELSQHVEILDLEYENCPFSENYEDFRDYTHARGNTLQVLAAVIAHQSVPELHVWRDGELVNPTE